MTAKCEPFRQVWDLTIEQLQDIVRQTQEILWVTDGNWSNDTPWSSDELPAIAEVLASFGLEPVTKEGKDNGNDE